MSHYKLHKAAKLWCAGHDTKEIARRLQTTEVSVFRAIPTIKLLAYEYQARGEA